MHEVCTFDISKLCQLSKTGVFFIFCYTKRRLLNPQSVITDVIECGVCKMRGLLRDMRVRSYGLNANAV